MFILNSKGKLCFQIYNNDRLKVLQVKRMEDVDEKSQN